MQVSVHFYSYFKDLAGCDQTVVMVADNSTLDDLLRELSVRFPKWAAMKNCALTAVGVEYQGRDYVLKAGDEVSLFPPVQGG
ncbi:MAG TPA: MoaD/ThiS family protein [Verrucomicrobiae bacterium]|jgi:molybdopterin synthase sulfur carrier subunit|nr:MoaD/ThiS family protein [Verrucomicrobiae bacterium]